jgi:dGTPase
VSKVYSMRGVLEIEAAGFEIIPGLLDAFADAAEKVAAEPGSNKRCPRARKLLELMPREFRESGSDAAVHPDGYIRLLGVVDFVAGMTDSFALRLYRRIKGIALPS